ncbi:MAG: rod shape-determining protein MreC [Zetaproteobacteria bacterium]|nr:rod shape-determining protein MreC [Zetaproteobacteria bacterium]
MNRKQRFRTFVILSLIIGALAYSETQPLGSRFTLIFSSLVETINRPLLIWQEVALWFQNRADLQQRYLQLQTEQQQNGAQAQQLRYLLAENHQLKTLLKLLNHHNDAFESWQPASIIGRTPEKKSQRLMIQYPNGHEDDVIISGSGLVGLVEDVNAQTATVRTILDASIAVPIYSPKYPKLAALCRGEGSQLFIDMVPQNIELNIDDILYTSGAGNLYPPGIAVAKVTHIEHPKGEVFSKIYAVPAAFWQNDRWLMVASTKAEE